MNLIDRINQFIEKQYSRFHKDPETGEMIETTITGPSGRKLKTNLRYGRTSLPREEMERRKLGIGEGPRRSTRGHFEQKAVHMTEEEAAQKLGVSIPPKKPTTTVEPSKIKKPSIPKTSKPKTSTIGTSTRTSRYSGVPAEIARQISPLGPGYHSVYDISQDVGESQRVSSKIKDFLSRKNKV